MYIFSITIITIIIICLLSLLLLLLCHCVMLYVLHLCYYYHYIIIFAKPLFTKPPFVNSRFTAAASPRRGPGRLR